MYMHTRTCSVVGSSSRGLQLLGTCERDKSQRKCTSQCGAAREDYSCHDTSCFLPAGDASDTSAVRRFSRLDSSEVFDRLVEGRADEVVGEAAENHWGGTGGRKRDGESREGQVTKTSKGISRELRMWMVTPGAKEHARKPEGAALS